MADPLEQLRERMAELADLRNVAQLLDWDQQTMMPPRGAPTRAETARDGPADQPRDVHLGPRPAGCSKPRRRSRRRSAGLRRRVHSSASSGATGRRRAVCPTELAADLARAASVGQEAWVRRASVGLRRRSRRTWSATSSSRAATSTASTSFDCAYDALLDDYEPEGRTSEVARLFDELRRSWCR